MDRRWRDLALLAYIGLLALTLAWETWLLPAPNFPLGFWAVVKALPLLLLLPGILRTRRAAYLGAMLLVLLYFIEGVVLIVSHRGEPLVPASVLPYAWAETALSLLFFAAAALHLRAARAVTRTGV